jgi:hypothetical protein
MFPIRKVYNEGFPGLGKRICEGSGAGPCKGASPSFHKPEDFPGLALSRPANSIGLGTTKNELKHSASSCSPSFCRISHVICWHILAQQGLGPHVGNDEIVCQTSLHTDPHFAYAMMMVVPMG